MSALWTSDEAAQATGGKVQGQWSVSGASIDTRTLAPGDLFIALQGEHRDGHAYVASALDRGAGAAMVGRVPDGVAAGAPLLIVGDTQHGLEALGRAARNRTEARIVAVTGSAGKTTTKEMLRQVLAREGNVAASVASYNNHWGVPLSLARMDRGASFGVFEIGMNHEGEIRALVRQVRPHAALITTIAPAHLEYFGSLDAIADAKAEIFEGIEPGGTAILPFDSPQFERLQQCARKAGVAKLLTFGTNPGATARLLSCTDQDSGQVISADVDGEKLTFAVGAPGAHIASNAMAVLLAAHALGVEPSRAALALANFSPLKGRGERVALGDIELIDESYNANPASMEAALDLLKRAHPKGNGQRVVILGDMLELGAQSGVLHRALAKPIADSGADLVFLCGPRMESLWDAVPSSCRGAYTKESSSLVPEVLARVQPGDVILVKGSFASRMSVIINALKSRGAAATL